MDSIKKVNQSMEETQTESVYIILHEALSLLHAEETINNLSITHPQISRIKNVSSGYQSTMSEYAEVNTSQLDLLHLDNVLQSFGLQKSGIPADGNCSFTSLILYLTNVFDDNKDR